MNKRIIQFFTTVVAAFAGVSAQAESPVSAGLLEHILSGRAVPGTYGGVIGTPEFKFPKGKYFITSVFCSMTSRSSQADARIYIASTDRSVKAPFYYVKAVIRKSEITGQPYLSAEPVVPLYVDNTSGKMTVRVDGLDDSNPVCQVVYLAYRY